MSVTPSAVGARPSASPIGRLPVRLIVRIAMIAFVSVVIQEAAISQISIFGVCADITPLVVMSIGLLCGSLAGAIAGFSVGLLVDLALVQTLGVTSLLYIVMTLNFFISGQMLPLDLLSPFWAGLLKALPFQYLAYFPATVFLGKVQGMQLVYGLLGELAWAVTFVSHRRSQVEKPGFSSSFSPISPCRA